MKELVYFKFLQEVGIFIIIVSYSQKFLSCPLQIRDQIENLESGERFFLLFSISLLYILSKLKLKQLIISQIICVTFSLGVIFTLCSYYVTYAGLVYIHRTVDFVCSPQIGTHLSLFGFILFILGSFFKKKQGST
jgi:hypothetical protein